MRKLTFLTLVVVIVVVGYTAFKNRTGNNSPAIANANTAGKINAPAGGSIYLQRDKRWAGDTIGGSGEKFGDVGCKVQRSAGIQENNHQGISPAVFRVSVRQGGGYIGYLTSFYNVPGIFGSVTAQSNNYVGVDCADVLMAAYGQWKNKPMPKNYNVSMLASSLTTVAEFDMSDGICPKNLRWKTDIHPGDFIAVKYPSSRQYAHIGALHSDTNKNGILDENDNIIHAGPSALHISKISDGNFNGHVKIIRP